MPPPQMQQQPPLGSIGPSSAHLIPTIDQWRYVQFNAVYVIYDIHCGEKFRFYGLSVSRKKQWYLCSMVAQAIKATMWMLQLQNIAGCWFLSFFLFSLSFFISVFISFFLSFFCFCFAVLAGFFISFGYLSLKCMHTYNPSLILNEGGIICMYACTYARYLLFMYVLFSGRQHPCSLASPMIILGIPSVVW